ncbi:MAG: hypothetical protein RIR26_937, partial [Pseudomonadota bacterium]
MVRSSSTQKTKEKKSESSRSSSSATTKAAAAKSAAAKAGAGSKTQTGKTSVAAKAKPTTSEKAAASKKPAARKAAPADKKATASRAKSKERIPTTPELFGDEMTAADVPNVSVLPQLEEATPDLEQLDALAKTPAEFKSSEVPTFAKLPEPAQSEPAPQDITFSFLGFNDQILEAIRKQKFERPTRVQALCLPPALDGKDVAGFAQTGTGKTAVYLLTMAHKLLSQENRVAQPHKPHALVIVPTRELADQVAQDAKRLLGSLQLKSLAVFGGVDVERHVSELNQAIDLVVATPGRLLDLHRSRKLELDDLQVLVIDECDRMFDMGFIDDVEYVLRHLPSERVQKLLFSATGSEKVKELAFEYLEEPEYIETDPVRITPERITQVAYAVTAEEKFPTLMGHIKAHNPECAIIFTNTKVVAEWVGYKLACNGLAAEVLTGDLPQRKRMTLIKKIKEGKCNLLVATDVLSRGLHVANLSHVYNFDIPDDEESFIHRIGRTARAGATGHAVTLICEDYGYNMGAVEELLGFKIPLEKVPDSYLQAPDNSDYPFDSQGRVKVFGQQAATATEESAPEARSEKRHERPDRRDERRHAGPTAAERPARPESTLPPHRRDTTRAAAQPNGTEERISNGPEPRNTEQPTPAHARPVPNGPTKPAASGPQPAAAQQRHAGPTPVAQHAAHAPKAAAAQQPQSGAAAGGHRGGTAPSSAASLPRRDERARETIDLAIQAAKKAAARRQGAAHPSAGISANETHGKAGKHRVTEQIDEIAAAFLTGAQEKLGGAFGNLQDK